jgi:hypothetical protein
MIDIAEHHEGQPDFRAAATTPESAGGESPAKPKRVKKAFCAANSDNQNDLFILDESEPSWRAWKPAEVPVGALIRQKHCWPARWIIVCATATGLGWFGMSGIMTFAKTSEVSDTENDFEHSLDGGKTWQPCGVKEEA